MGEKRATQITDNNESLVCPAEKPQLVDMKAWEDATKLTQEKNACEMEKSQGKRPSKTLESFPKFHEPLSEDEKTILNQMSEGEKKLLDALRAMSPEELKAIRE